MASAEHDPAASLMRLPREQTRWLSGLARQAKGLLICAIAGPLLAGALLVVQAWLLASVLDGAIVQGLSREELLTQIIWIAVLMAVRTLLTWQGERAGSRAAEKIKYLVRQALFMDILERGPQWTRQQASGSLASVLVEQVDALEGFFAHYLPAMIAGTCLPIAFAIIILPLDWVAGLLLLVTAPLIPVFMALVGWGAESASRQHLDAFARLSGFFADRVRGLSTLKLYGQADIEAERVYQASDTLRSKTMSVLRIAFLSSAVLEFFAALGVAGTALYIGLSFLGFVNLRGDDVLTLQVGMFCLLMAPEVYNPLRQFAAHYHDRAAARAAVGQMGALFESLPSVEEQQLRAEATGEESKGEEAREFQRERPANEHRAVALDVQGLCLKVPGRAQALFESLSFSIRIGQTVALMGDSGIGKTTLLETLVGLRSVEGRILWAGRPLEEWARAELYQEVALIGQHAYIHSGTIADNLRLAAPEASDEQLLAATHLACMDDFISLLPHGLATQLGTRGYGLSGGQLQRIALARLFLRDPSCILLDEPTAHLDPDTRDRVLENLLRFSQGRSLLVVTHDPVVARRMDTVWQMQMGSEVLTPVAKENL